LGHALNLSTPSIASLSRSFRLYSSYFIKIREYFFSRCTSL